MKEIEIFYEQKNGLFSGILANFLVFRRQNGKKRAGNDGGKGLEGRRPSAFQHAKRPGTFVPLRLVVGLLRLPEFSASRTALLKIQNRGAKNSFLHPPQAAVGIFAVRASKVIIPLHSTTQNTPALRFGVFGGGSACGAQNSRRAVRLLANFDRGAKNSFLHPPQAAVGIFAVRASKSSSLHIPPRKKTRNFRSGSFWWWTVRDSNP